jgi:hypothetical protein
MPLELHSHNYGGRTSFNDGHIHEYMGQTSVNPDYRNHIHYMEGETSFNDGHEHYYAISTGPAIYVDGGHYHNYFGYTRVADRHIHRFGGRTSIYRD